MNRNRKNRKNRKRQVVTSVAAAMAGIMGAVPVLAATEEAQISKEETVYVNADAKGQEKQIIVSDWLKRERRRLPEKEILLPGRHREKIFIIREPEIRSFRCP